METVVGFVENGGRIEESRAALDSSTFPSSKKIAAPVVYKLVRVEGDGRFVPATDDEVMEVEDFLVDDENEKVAIAGQIVGCISTEGLSRSESLEADAGYNARLEYIEEVLQKVKQEERLHLACGSPIPSSSYMNRDKPCSDQRDRLPDIDEKLQSKVTVQEIVHSASPNFVENRVDQHGSIGDCLKHLDRSVEPESSDAICTAPKPDFSLLKGEICLNNLSIRELHEYFKATFGRETTVKDKSWLKRRIAMGLTNSCDVAASSFIINEGKWVTNGREENSQNVEGTSNIPTFEALNVDPISPSTIQCLENKDHNYAANMEHDGGCEDQHEQKAALKRIRKPTKRYIEELSEVESIEHGQKTISLNKNSVSDSTPFNSILRPIKKITSDGERTVITRMDLLGGSGFEVPCVSRVRRSRPRKDIVALMFTSPDKDQDPSTMDTNEMKNLEQQQTVSGDASANTVIALTPKGGVRRKHHRAWTLVEVMKLVEGVSKCGAGRWSEIKRLAFASYSYRTSVDLKDKWRNLLKASFAKIPVDEGINSRKHAAVPIPAQILLRVRELAEMHAQIPSNNGSGKLCGVGATSMPEMGSMTTIKYKKETEMQKLIVLGAYHLLKMGNHK